MSQRSRTTSQAKNQVTSHSFSTKVSKDAPSGVKTEATIEWDIDQQTILKQAAASLIIMQQALYRASGQIPAKASLKASEIIKAKGELRGAPKALTAEQIVAKATQDKDVLRKVLQAAGLTEQAIKKALA